MVLVIESGFTLCKESHSPNLLYYCFAPFPLQFSEFSSVAATEMVRISLGTATFVGFKTRCHVFGGGAGAESMG